MADSTGTETEGDGGPPWRGLKGAFGGLAVLDERQRLAFAGAAALVLGATLLDVAAIAFTFVIIRTLVDPAGASHLPVIAVLYRHGLLGSLRWLPVSVSLLYFAFILAKNAYGIAMTWYQERLFARVAASIGGSLLTSYLHASWNVMASRKAAEMMNVADVAGGAALTSVFRAYLTLATELSVLLAVLALLLWLAPVPTLVSILLLGTFFGFVQRGIRARIEELGRICTALANERLQFFQQCLESGREIRISGRIGWFVTRFAELRMREARALQSIMSLQSIPRYLSEPVLFGAMTIVIISITLTSADSNVALPTLGIFAVAGFRLMPSVSRSLSAGATLLGFAHPVSTLRRDLALPAEQATPSASTASPALRREIAVDGITYRYPGRGEAALNGVSFSLAKGEAVAIVGASGAGKSTLADIFVGLRRPDSGAIRLDGADIAADLAAWRARIGYVPQVVSLFDAGLRENVAFGLDAIDDARVRHVLSLVQLDGLLAKLDGSLASRIGERGTAVSVGERQRIGIARALYDNREILVMDEATAALDSDTEDLLGNAIDALLGQCTVLVIAHRVATIRRCGRIVVLEGGRVADIGTYDALLGRSPTFARLVRQGVFEAAEQGTMMHVLTRIVWLVFLPSNFVILLFAAGVALSWTSRVRLGRILARIAAVAGLALVLLPLDQWAAAPLETRYLRPAKPPAHVDGILILGGYFSNLVEGAAVARRYPEARVVYSGGSSYLFGDDGSPQYALETLRSLGVDPGRIVIEGKSRTTFEDIQYSRALVAPKNGQVWLLVTTAVHMTRAKAVANHFGWQMTPWTSENIADASLKTYWLFDYAKTSYNLGRVLHEYEALLAYRLEGKIDTMSP